jgi:regulator of nucleoside diphosphate kinase
MGSEVVYRDDTTGRVQTVTLVYPSEADIAKGKVSVLTPIGTALIGLAVGKSINWRTRAGDMKRLTVLQVRDSAAAEALAASDAEAQPA